MSLASIMSQFPSFVRGLRLIDGEDLRALGNLLFSYNPVGITALAGGGQVGATPLPFAVNEISVAASANDSVALPLAVPAKCVWVNNDGAQSVQVFGQATNPNTGVGDTIAPNNSINQAATATGVAQASAKIACYVCFAPGKWKQFLTA